MILSWTSVNSALGYNVFRSLKANGEGAMPYATLSAQTSFVDTAVAAGTTYFYQVAAVNAAGQGPRSDEIHVTPVLAVHVNFTAPTGAAVPGYLTDLGQQYGLRTGGFHYGWTMDDSSGAVDVNAVNSVDELHDSLHEMQHRPGTQPRWHIALPNGTYSVHIVMGDPTTTNGVYRLNVLGGGSQIAAVRAHKRPTILGSKTP